MSAIFYTTGQDQAPIKPRRERHLYTIKECESDIPDLSTENFRPRSHQIFMFKLNSLDFTNGPEPYPPEGKPMDYWNKYYVKMPNSPNNTFKEEYKILGISKEREVTFWSVIEKTLSQRITRFEDLDKMVRQYNHYDDYDFDVLRSFLEPQPIVSNAYTILNNLAQLALNLPQWVTRSVPHLKRKNDSTLILSQKQIACLLANGFFCTFPRRSRENQEYKNFPCFNFVRLFTSEGNFNEKTLKIEKLKCLFNYFDQVQKEMPTGVVSFERRYLSEVIDWENSEKGFKYLRVENNGSQEENGKGFAEVDFANPFIGGDVLNAGALQEEIRFLLSPELIVSRLFTEALLDEEALVINGTVRYNQHKGFGHLFKWTGSVWSGEDSERDRWGRHYTQVIAIDGTDYQSFTKTQFGKIKIERDLNKAFAGFRDDHHSAHEKPAIASGKWSCGGFHGDPFLNCLLQFIAASQADRDLILFLKNDPQLEEKLSKFYVLVALKELTIGQVFKAILNYSKENDVFRRDSTVIDYICEKLK